MKMLELAIYAGAILVVVMTVLPVSRSHRWWIRIFDFPRFHILIVGLGVLVSALFVRQPPSLWDAALITILAFALLWQLSWIWRYFPFSPLEVRNAASTENRIRLVTTNVYQKSRDADGLLRIIRKADPDVVLAVETDEWWCSALKEGLGSYPHGMVYPLSNGYGLTLFSRFELAEPSFRFLVDEAIPSIKTGVRLQSGAVIDLYGVHPQPPAPPNQDSTERDTELVIVGREIARGQRPAIVLGDLNDVAWSPTTSRFKEAGALLDPRRGRGFFNTYPAWMPGLRYPLDYVFHTRHFTVSKMEVLPRFGSDHLPLCITLHLEPDMPS
jgi:endonuclease/exonuclease/phosphatase (EEP) superfamily protein YafD